MTENIEERLHNTEAALFCLWSLIKDTFPPEHQNSVDTMMQDFFNANVSLGSDLNKTGILFTTLQSIGEQE